MYVCLLSTLKYQDKVRNDVDEKAKRFMSHDRWISKKKKKEEENISIMGKGRKDNNKVGIG